MGRIARFPGITPAPAVMRILGRFDRPTLEAFLAVAIDLLDTLDGDPDTEDDDPAGQCDEDGVNTRDNGSVAFAPDDLECGLTPDWGINQTKPLAAAIVIEVDQEGMQAHRDRIRATRCVPEYQRDWRTEKLEPSTCDFILVNEPTVPTKRQLLKRKRGVPRQPRG